MPGPESNPNGDLQRHGQIDADERPSTFSAVRKGEFADTVVPETDDADQNVTNDSASPTAFGRYRVIRPLGRGGMGSVYLGYDDQLDRQVAIKVPHSQLFQTSEGRDAFLREARTLAKLEHPRIIAVHDAGQTDDGNCYVVFKFVDGQTLKERIRDMRLPPREASDMLAEVADALHYAHKQGFVHRDIKPSNILIDRDGKAWVADFGLAVAESAQQRMAGEVSGTPAYMSPEQTRGDAHHLDGRTDIWSVGVMLYELLTGRRPFSGSDMDAVFAEIIQKEPRPPRMIDETIPEELERIILKCLHKPVAERYTTAHDLARDLRGWGTNKRSIPVLTGALVGVGLLALVVAIVVINLNRPAAIPESSIKDLEPVVATPEPPPPVEASELALLIEEMRGLRQDLGESNVRSGDVADSEDATESSADNGESLAVRTDTDDPPIADPLPIELPPGEWAPIPLPAGFGELEALLRKARASGDEDEEDSLLLRATNELIAAGHYAIAEHLAYRMVELAGNDPGDVPFAYGQLGLAQYRLGKHDEALASYQRSADIYQGLYDQMMSLPDSEQILEFRSHLARLLGMTLMRMGNVHKAADDSQLARIRYEESKKLFEAHDRQEELATLLLNYGGLESSQGNYEQAIGLLQQGLVIVQMDGSDEEIAELHVNLGNAYSRDGDNKSALEQYQLAHNRVNEDSDYVLRSALLGNYATSLLEEGRNEQALQLLRELKSILRPGDTDSQRVLEFLPVLEQELGPV